jgi:putative transposase
MESFTRMVNECVRIGSESGATSYDSLSEAAKSRMGEYRIDEDYKVSAASRALRMLKLFRSQVHREDTNLPICRKPMLAAFKGLRLTGRTLSIPGGAAILLNDYMARSLKGYLAPRLVVLTPDHVHVTVSRHVSMQHISGMAGIDTNLDNLTLVDTLGNLIRYDMGRIPRIIEGCLRAKRGLRRNDAKVRVALFRKYGQIERDRIGWIVHNVSSRIVAHALRNGLALAIEDLSGIRMRYTAKAGHSRAFLRRRNAWPHFELRRQLEYKASWNGIPVITVNAEYTSAECHRCGEKTMVAVNNSKALYCPHCASTMDRDENAARNILRRGLRSRLMGSASEAVKRDQVETKPPDSKADADQSTGSAG